MNEEFDSLVRNETWDLVELPEGRQTISCRWVYKLKLKRGVIERFKARLVARGFTQRYGIDYTDTLSPVVRMDTIRMLLILANQFNWNMIQMDVKTAFLNGTLREEIFMEQPQGLKESNLVCKLKRSIYGLKQASLDWNRCITEFLAEFNLKPLMSDPCVFVNNGCNIAKTSDPVLIICIHVDDGLI